MILSRPGTTRRGLIAGAAAMLALAGLPRPGAAEPVLRIGSLRFGSVNWLLETIEAEGLAEAEGLRLERVDVASSQATTIALQAGDVDMIVSDWLWAMRQRSEGEDFLFHAYSSALGALMAPAGSGIAGLADLEGKRLGVAGSPLDKSWLIMRAQARERLGRDLADMVEPVYGAPPLLSEQLRIGRVDAVLTYWNFAARLDAEGFERVLGIEDLMRDLGMDPPPPLVGFVWRERTSAQRGAAVEGFFRAVDAANAVLADSDHAWEHLRPAMQLGSEAEFPVLRDYFRAGIPAADGADDIEANRRLFDLLAEMGGADVIGPRTRFDPALFGGAS